MKTVSDIVAERLKNVIILDRSGAIPSRLYGILEKDILSALDNYFDIQDLNIEIQYDSEGEPFVSIVGLIGGFKPFNAI